MNCLEFRRQLLVDPNTIDKEILHHLKNCTACAESYSESNHFNEMVALAVEIGTPENLQSDILLRHSFKSEGKGKLKIHYALAASLLIFITAALMAVWHHEYNNLNKQVIAYVKSVHTNDYSGSRVDYQMINQVLRPLGMVLDSEFGTVNAISPCIIRGNIAAHFVVAGSVGSIDILYMPSEDIEKRVQSNQQQKQLILTPCPKGSVAIIGSNNEELTNIENRLHSAAHWL